MSVLILFPALACWAVIAQWSTRKALLNVFLPCLLLLPQYYILREPHLPPITFADAAILPLGLALLVNGLRGWRLDWMDLAVLLVPVSWGLSEGLSAQLAGGDSARPLGVSWENGGMIWPTQNPLGDNLANGALMLVGGLMTIVLPYMAGKLLIERPDENGRTIRTAFAARIATLLAIVGFLSIRDFITGKNSWLTIGGIVFPKQLVIWPPQMRWGFGRIAGPFGHAILAGMAFLIGFCYCLWLEKVEPQWAGRKLFHGMPFTLRGLVMVGVVLGILMTQSRGPWVGMGLALVFALLTRRYPLVKAGLLFLLFLACVAPIAYYVGEKYTDSPILQAGNEEQQNAIYRRELLTNYLPIIKQRPLFGWGITTYPKMGGQSSIDNEYLLEAVTQGIFGLGLFLAVALGTAARLFRLLGHRMGNQDRLLIFAHLTVLIGLLTTITTVYLGEQVITLFFLFAGWVQGMDPAYMRAPVIERVAPRPAFRRVMV